MNTNPPADWLEFWVRFVCGALLGGFAGFGLWQEPLSSSPHAWLAVPAGSVLLGLAAGWSGDRFWHTCLRWFGW